MELEIYINLGVSTLTLVVTLLLAYPTLKSRCLRRELEKATREYNATVLEVIRYRHGAWRNPQWVPNSDVPMWIYDTGICGETFIEDKAVANKNYVNAANRFERARDAERLYNGGTAIIRW